MAKKNLGPEIAGVTLGVGTGAAHGAMSAKGLSKPWHPLVSGGLGAALAVGGYMLQGKGKSRKQKQTGEYMAKIGTGVTVAAGASALKEGVEDAMNPYVAARREHERLLTRAYWLAKGRIEDGKALPTDAGTVAQYESESEDFKALNESMTKQLEAQNAS